MPVVAVDYSFRDDSDTEAQVRVWLVITGSPAAAVGRVAAIGARLAALSDAILFKARLSLELELPPSNALQPTANVYRRGFLLFRNGGDVCSLAIPSFRRDLTEAVGDYAGIRVTPASLSGAGLLLPLNQALARTVTPWGDPWPVPFVVGGINGVAE